MEGEQEETISNIHTYLASFDKDIQSETAEAKNVTQVFVDQNGHFLYHAIQNEEMVIVSEDAKSDSKPDEGTKTESIECETEELDTSEASEAITTIETTDNNQLICGVQRNNLLTLLPNGANDLSELSYFMIVEQPEDQKDDSVFEFNESDDPINCSPIVEDKKMIRVVSKRSQPITSMHMCTYCNYTSPKRYLLARHMRSHSEERPHKCSDCDRGFKTLPSLQNHVNTHTGKKPHKCRYCSSTFTTSGELVRHVRYRHTHEKPHKCPHCDYASVELSKLKRHVRCHTGERPYQCPHCTYASPDTFKLKRHMRIHTGEKPYECDICYSKFTQSNSLKAHKLIHSGNKPVYACELCPTTCGRKTDLRIHVQKLHTPDPLKPLKCPKCDKSFPDRYTYKIHVKSHDGEKCFKCDLCSYSSSASRHLEAHMLVHTEQKPFQCSECELAFRQKQLLKRHFNLFHNPSYVPPVPKEKNLVCGVCNRSFRHKGYLLRHMATHDNELARDNYHDLSKTLAKSKKASILSSGNIQMFNSGESNVITVGNDGNQYVVLEVIQYQDPASHVMMSETLSGHHLQNDQDLSADLIQGKGLQIEMGHEMKLEPDDKQDVHKEMESCFGFEEDECSEMSLQFGE